MPSQTKENYLKAIYFLHQKKADISVTELANMMEVSTPTVNNMVKKLQANDWVLYQKYKPINLTSKGEKIAALIVRKHRLAEMFLAQIMGFGWEEVHDIAEEMEHVKSEELFDRMDELLGFPTIDPHGSPIPDKEGHTMKKNYPTLSLIQEGKKVRLCALNSSTKELLLYLTKKRISLGTELVVLQKEPFDNSMTVSYDNQNAVVLSNEVCSCLLVEEH